MPREKTSIQPQVIVGDTIIKAGCISLDGFDELLAKVEQLDLSPPTLHIPSGQKTLALVTLDDVNTLMAANLPIIGRWLLRQGALIRILVARGSNVPAEKIGDLDAPDAVLIAAAVVEATIAAGLAENYVRFFGGLLAPVFRALSGPESPPGENQPSTDGRQPISEISVGT
ncbi:MAG: hypothetical protein KGL39_16295 [Patescibacteria group bacterium]|nr:hypothetical protein [Patescibacteria group bacterium]